jgi:pyruvate dehydrogenase E2 component (dihydrolipoamide acetyltransferase)
VADLLTMPEVAAGATEAVLSSWNVALDAPFSAGDTIVTVETEKAVVDVEADADGVLLHLLVAEGATVEVGAPIAVKGAPGEKVEDLASLLASLGAAGSEATPTGPAAEEVAGADEPEAAGSRAAAEPSAVCLPVADVPAVEPLDEAPQPSRIFASPLARRLAREAGLDVGTLTGTGPNGRIRRADVEAALHERLPGDARPEHAAAAASGAAADAPTPLQGPVMTSPSYAAGGTPHGAGWTDVPNSRLRQAVARRLTESKQTAPHFYVRGSARVDRLLELRRELNDDAPVKVSVNDLVVKAVGAAHTRVPGLNVQWNGDSVRQFSSVDVAIAVATDLGLVTPVVRGVDMLSVSRLAGISQDLVARARGRRLQQAELEGGSISVTNLGMYGTEEFAAIINPPQASILAVGAARQEAVVDHDQVAVGTVLHVTLAVDHRPVDGATAAEWMAAFTALLEHPLQIIA